MKTIVTFLAIYLETQEYIQECAQQAPIERYRLPVIQQIVLKDLEQCITKYVHCIHIALNSLQIAEQAL